ncbi:Pentatricopeptide repeat-containing protein [Artemisia annua]|uniref:Pentatricopeptide repeat-containing protein n=1 Tax=Artemisia annua TaxID=35608 RepID=A0A2U1QNA0_ARTAN|nr:Pentatricopeptide repeat-containing protein [Artemisia annua]
MGEKKRVSSKLRLGRFGIPPSSTIAAAAASASTNAVLLNPSFPYYSSPVQKLHAEDVALTFQDTCNHEAVLNLRLTESLVLDVLYYGKDVLAYIKFFDWAGRQPAFQENPSLHSNYLAECFGRKPNLDVFAYHVLLNALVEENYYVGVEAVSNQIKSRGFESESEVTHSILIKCFCRNKEFDRAETYLRGVMEGGVKIKGGGVINLIKAGKLVDEFGQFHVYDIWIRELVRARKLDGAMEFLHKTRMVVQVEDGYYIHGELSRLNKVTTGCAYNSLINSFIKSNRADIAVRLLIEMQEKGHAPSHQLFRAVIQSVCETENLEKQFQRLLEMRLSIHEIDCGAYNIFIEGAGLAKKPDLANEVYQMMKRSGISPNVTCDILLLRSYLKGEKISDALYLFHNLYDTWVDARPPTELTRLESSPIWRIREVVGLFSDRFRDDISTDDLEQAVRNCFPPDIYTHNMLLRKLCTKQVDDADKLFDTLCPKGYEPNQWTYETMVHGFYKHGRKDDAKLLLNEMVQGGFQPSKVTSALL